jgi:hypothetical protein
MLEFQDIATCECNRSPLLFRVAPEFLGKHNENDSGGTFERLLNVSSHGIVNLCDEGSSSIRKLGRDAPSGKL